MNYNNANDIRTLMVDLDRKRTDTEKALHPTARERAVGTTQQIIDAYASALKGEWPNVSSLGEGGWFSTCRTMASCDENVFCHVQYLLQDKGFRTKIVPGQWSDDVILIRV